MKLTVLFCLTAFVHIVFCYSLKTEYSGSSFFSKFNYFSGSDPTHGFVQYQNAVNAKSLGLTFVKNNRVIIKADNKTVAANGRPSIRLESKETYHKGLFIFDLNHMPSGCGTWPAYWMMGSSWPFDGEIDILEGVNKQKVNALALHTGNTCTMAGAKQIMKGLKSQYPNCYAYDPEQPPNNGCSISDTSTSSYGAGFNKNKGGVYAMLWDIKKGFQVWFFPRASIPKDIRSGKALNPAKWGTPVAHFPFCTQCKATSFKDMKIIINLTFCGDWAGNAYISSGCPSTCVDHVKNTPGAFDEAYWDINYLRVYQ
ncbi:concanavalin A-like lectin/glucanase domain-containing protein [Gilbertella persicaria]|uniref:concanavalin A-like lectin/glucanase domain-containing protein n=1 Tax=Gilbertella persicaria TaxID=101096 RepID=UPI00221EB12C|nr:concanavalin A-like lectin/glucanase domain-containing protein [Gilbertella persicaria]KAI8069785.1 concanavalin A-like lectin/glucanase domain-containing protein [Gilbertella persicaria]